MISCPEGGDALNAFALAAARAFVMDGATASAWAKAMAAAVAQYGCDAVKPALAGAHNIHLLHLQAPFGACQGVAIVVMELTGQAMPSLTQMSLSLVQSWLGCHIVTCEKLFLLACSCTVAGTGTGSRGRIHYSDRLCKCPVSAAGAEAWLDVSCLHGNVTKGHCLMSILFGWRH